MILTIIMCILSVCCFVISILQFKEKGFLFNNSYIYASEDERKKMNKTPYYRQSGVCFLLISIIFAVNAIEVAFELQKLFYLVIVLVIVTVVYAIISSVKTEKRNKS